MQSVLRRAGFFAELTHGGIGPRLADQVRDSAIVACTGSWNTIPSTSTATAIPTACV